MKISARSRKILTITFCFLMGVTAYAASVRLKTYLEIQSSFETATHVSSSQRDIANFFDSRQSKLPRRGDWNEVNEQSSIVTLGLASLYCSKMIEKDAATAVDARWAHRAVKFDQRPSQNLLSTEILKTVIQDYAQLFWQRPALAAEVNSMTNFARSMAADLPDETPSNPKILTSLCSVFGASWSAITF